MAHQRGLSLDDFGNICKGLRKFDDYNFLIHCSIEEEQIAKNLKISIDNEVTIRVIEPKKSILNISTQEYDFFSFKIN